MAGYLGATPVPQATQHRESFTATAAQTTFATAGYTVGFVDVYLNGVHLTPADVTATNGSDVVLGACLVNDIVDVISYSTFELNAQTFIGDVTFADGADIITASAGTSNFRAGVNAGNSIASGGNFNVTVGDEAGTAITTADNNTAVGYQAGAGNVTGADLTAIGFKAGVINTGAFNTFVGKDAGLVNTAGTLQTFIGEFSGRATTGTNNTFLGQQAGSLVTSGTKNTVIGRYNGNLGGLDIRTTSNNIVLSDGDGNPRIIVDSTGAVTQPLQPAFLAKVGSVQSNLADYTNVVIFGTEIFDQNADFNPSNGIFTAPVTGRYMLSTFIGLDQIPATGTGVLQLQFVVSNRTVYAAFDPVVFDATSTKYTFTQSLLLDMDASDTAKIQIYMPVSSSTVDINVTSYFSGYLVA